MRYLINVVKFRGSSTRIEFILNHFIVGALAYLIFYGKNLTSYLPSGYDVVLLLLPFAALLIGSSAVYRRLNSMNFKNWVLYIYVFALLNSLYLYYNWVEQRTSEDELILDLQSFAAILSIPIHLMMLFFEQAPKSFAKVQEQVRLSDLQEVEITDVEEDEGISIDDICRIDDIRIHDK